MHKNSALGSFLFRTALKNKFDFHPMTVSRYSKEGMLEGILLRLPDALFDSAWLNTEGYQTDRPAFPHFTDFHHLFSMPREQGASPLMLGFEGFYRGAFSYHFHNYWCVILFCRSYPRGSDWMCSPRWEPFDPSRDWPDLGPRFIKAERAGRREAQKKANKDTGTDSVPPPVDINGDFGDKVQDDTRDLSWATVLKRTFEAYIRGERPNMYGEYIVWS